MQVPNFRDLLATAADKVRPELCEWISLFGRAGLRINKGASDQLCPRTSYLTSLGPSSLIYKVEKM